MNKILLVLLLCFFSCKKDLKPLKDSPYPDFYANSFLSDIELSVIDNFLYDSTITNVGENYMFLGSYNYPDFGLLKPFVISELSHPNIPVFGDEIIDSVILKLYFTKSEDSIKYYDNKKIMAIGNSISNTGVDIKITSIDTEIPDTIIGTGSNKFNPSDSKVLLNISNYNLNPDDHFSFNINEDKSTEDKKVYDTIKDEAHVKLYLERSFWQDILSKYSGKILDDKNFKREVKGIKIVFSNHPSIFYFLASKFSITVHYHNNRNISKSYIISLNSEKTGNIFDFTESANFSNSKQPSYNGNDLYLFGLNNSLIKMKILSNENIKALRDSMWIINKAEIIIEPKSDYKIFPNNIAIYKRRGNSLKYITDFLYSTIYNPKGYLDDSKYSINLTGHVSSIINKDSSNVDLDINILNPSQNPKGFVFDKNNVKLKIYYSKHP